MSSAELKFIYNNVPKLIEPLSPADTRIIEGLVGLRSTRRLF